MSKRNLDVRGPKIHSQQITHQSFLSLWNVFDDNAIVVQNWEGHSRVVYTLVGFLLQLVGPSVVVGIVYTL